MRIDTDPDEHEARPLFVDEAVMVRPVPADLLDAMMAAF